MDSLARISLPKFDQVQSINKFLDFETCFWIRLCSTTIRCGILGFSQHLISFFSSNLVLFYLVFHFSILLVKVYSIFMCFDDMLGQSESKG